MGACASKASPAQQPKTHVEDVKATVNLAGEALASSPKAAGLWTKRRLGVTAEGPAAAQVNIVPKLDATKAII
ncbi:hypothetical protein HaLaN_14570, partial [Haematococcus lacustris]